MKVAEITFEPNDSAVSKYQNEESIAVELDDRVGALGVLCKCANPIGEVYRVRLYATPFDVAPAELLDKAEADYVDNGVFLEVRVVVDHPSFFCSTNLEALKHKRVTALVVKENNGDFDYEAKTKTETEFEIYFG